MGEELGKLEPVFLAAQTKTHDRENEVKEIT